MQACVVAKSSVTARRDYNGNNNSRFPSLSLWESRGLGVVTGNWNCDTGMRENKRIPFAADSFATRQFQAGLRLILDGDTHVDDTDLFDGDLGPYKLITSKTSGTADLALPVLFHRPGSAVHARHTAHKFTIRTGNCGNLAAGR